MDVGELLAEADLTQAAVQLARGPAVHEQLTAGTGGQQACGLALGDVPRPASQDPGRDRRAEDGRADQQGPGPGAQPVKQLAEQLITHGQGDQLRGRPGELGGFGPVGGADPVHLAGPRLNRGRDAAGHLAEALAAGEHRVQVLHGQRVARGQPPRPLAFRFCELAERGERHRELTGAGSGQRPDVLERETPGFSPGQGERPAARDQELPGPAGQQIGQRRVSDTPAARLLRQVVIKVVKNSEPTRLGFAGQAGGGHLPADRGDRMLRRQMAQPRGDLAGEGRLADAADAVQDESGHLRAGQVPRPAAPLGGPDRQGGPAGGRRLRGPGAAG